MGEEMNPAEEESRSPQYSALPVLFAALNYLVRGPGPKSTKAP